METVLFSIIIPIYNAQNYLEDLLQDIQRQGVHEFEVLMIDDGSVDGSSEICRRHTVLDTRFRYFRQENQGVSAARNRGIELSRGKYLLFLDADDRIPEDTFIQYMKKLVENPEIDLVIGKYQTIGDFSDQNSSLFWQSDLSGKKKYLELLSDCLNGADTFYYGAVWNKVFRRDIIQEYQIQFDETMKWSEDFDFCVRYFRYVRYCYYLKSITYCYYRRPGSALSQDGIIDDRIDFLRYRLLSAMTEEIEDDKQREIYQKKTDLFLICRVHGVMSTKAKNWKMLDRHSYKEWKDYMFIQENMAVWKNRKNFHDLTRAQKIVWAGIETKCYYLVYAYYILKSRMKKIKTRQSR